MDEDVPRAPRAGRRAARTENTWEDDGSMPPEPQKGGFGLESGFSGPSPTPPLPKPTTTDTDDSSDQPRARNNNDDSSSASTRGQTGEAGSGRLQRPAPPSRPSAAGMLGEDSKKFAGISRRKQEQLARGDDEVSRKNMKYEALTAGVDGIMEIPELEDEGREDLSNVVAEAPKVRTNRVQGMDELEENVHYKLPAMDDRDIDLSLLTAVLCSSEQVQEADESWDPDIIITEVASAINAEREKAEGGEGSAGPEEGAPAAGREELVAR